MFILYFFLYFEQFYNFIERKWKPKQKTTSHQKENHQKKFK